MKQSQLCGAAFVALLTAAAGPVMADDAEILVTGEGLVDPDGVAAYGSVTIPRERLESEASGRLEDVLRDVAGFQQFRRVDSRAANPTSQGATLRALGGNASSRALLLLDGVPQADPFTGYIPYSAIEPDRLRSIRVTRGGGAGPFGAGAVAGTIELMSGGPDELPELAARGAYGSRESTELAAGIVQPLSGGFAAIEGNWEKGDGYVLIPRDQRGAVDIPALYELRSLTLRGVLPTGDDSEIQARSLFFEDDRLRGQEGTDSESRGADASIRFVSRGDWDIEALAYVQERNFSSGFVSTATDRNSSTPTLDQFSTPSTGIGGKIELRPLVGGGHVLRIGADARHTSGRTNERFRFVAGAATRLRRAGGKTLNAGLFIEDDWQIGALTLTGGARIDRWDIKGGFLHETDIGTGAATQTLDFPDRGGWRPTGRIGALYPFSGSLALRAAAYSGFRLPTLNELYRPFRVGADANAANASLRLEKLNGVEAGLNFHPAPATRFGLTLFWNRLDDAIANVTVANGPGMFPQVGFVSAAGVFRQRMNVDAIRVLGIEATGQIALGDFHLSASYAFADARVRASGAAAALDGKRPAQAPRHQASGTLAWGTGEDEPMASVTVRYAGAQYEDDLQSRKIPDALTVDAVASIPLTDGLRIVGRAENIFDETVVSGISSASVIDRGTPRTLWLGFNLEY